VRHSTTDTYQLKREILAFAHHLSAGTPKDWQKFTADMLFGMLASSSCILSRFADALKEPIRKQNTVERLSRKLTEHMPEAIRHNYLSFAREIADTAGPVFVDASDIIKPYGKAFEDLGLVRDGSSPDAALQKGYHVMEITAVSRRKQQPVSLFSHIFSARTQGFTSINDVTFHGLRQSFSYFPNATYVFDRGYDMNKLFAFMYTHNKQFIVRIKENRNVFVKGKWLRAGVLRDRYKGKLNCRVLFGGKETECRVSCINVQVTASRRRLKLVLVYGLSDSPMMLLTNRPVKNKDDVLRVVRTYFMRWRIEEHFRLKKYQLGFEDMRVRKLKAMNNLNHFLNMAITMLCAVAEKQPSSRLRAAVMKQANAQKKEHQVLFLLYRIGLGFQRILAQARTGIRAWFHIGRPKHIQLSFPLLC